jgi:hypothetical protein
MNFTTYFIRLKPEFESSGSSFPGPYAFNILSLKFLLFNIYEKINEIFFVSFYFLRALKGLPESLFQMAFKGPFQLILESVYKVF